jgi:phenylacetate-CoA ligase
MGPRFEPHYRAIREREGFTREQIRAYQNEHFLRIFRHAFDSVPAYRELYEKAGVRRDAIRSIDDIDKLPCIDKEVVKARPESFLADHWEKYGPVLNKTSGSTGMPMNIRVDGDLATMVQALIWRHLNWAGLTFRDRSAYIERPLGYMEGRINRTDLYTTDRSRKNLAINTAMIGPDTLPRICSILEEFQADAIHGYPNMLLLLSEYLRAHPRYRIRPKCITLRSEKVAPEQRKTIEEAFACEAFELFAHWEYICFAADCAHHNLHHFFDLGVVEVMRGTTRVNPGEVGELVCTGLHNRSMPLIRYRTGDLGTIKEGKCPCGLEMPVIEIHGSRGKDLIVTRTGYFEVMSGLPVKMQQVKPFRQIQFVQKDLDRLEVRIVKLEDFNAEEIEGARRIVRDFFDGRIEVTIAFVEEIPRTEAMKYKYVESSVPWGFS